MSAESVLYERHGAACWLIINRPERRNSLNDAVIAGILAGLDAAQRDPEVRSIVLTGAGDKAFCAGADLSSSGPLARDQAPPSATYPDLLKRARRLQVPLIGRINGSCIAGGMGLLAVTDIAIAADHAQFGLPEVRVGLFPMQVAAVLQGQVSRRLLSEWSVTGSLFSADVARAAGLLNSVVPLADLDAAIAALTDRISAGSPLAIKRGLQAMRVMETLESDAALALGAAELADLAASDDAREGIAAFNERRKPLWRGS